MAYLTLSTVSSELQMTTYINMIIPDSARCDKPLIERKVLYLLHGLSDNATMWVRRSNVEDYAEKYGIVIVMPSADRSFYLDDVLGQNYFSYITKELPDYLHKTFNLSTKKEDNFIAGMSMGGYGAMRAALKCPDRYFAVASFSGVLAFEPMLMAAPIEDLGKRVPALYEKRDTLLTSDLNVLNLLTGKTDLKAYVSCGFNDDTIYCSRMFEEKAKAVGFEANYYYGEGEHNWRFWNCEIEKFLAFALEN